MSVITIYRLRVDFAFPAGEPEAVDASEDNLSDALLLAAEHMGAAVLQSMTAYRDVTAGGAYVQVDLTTMEAAKRLERQICSLIRDAGASVLPEEGAPSEAIRRLSESMSTPLTADEVACLQDPNRMQEALDMLDTLCLLRDASGPACSDVAGGIYAPRSVLRASMSPQELEAALTKLVKLEIVQRERHACLDMVCKFSDIHYYMDANMLGGMCDNEVQDAMDSVFPGRLPGDLSSCAAQAMCGRVQSAVDIWLREEGMQTYTEGLLDLGQAPWSAEHAALLGDLKEARAKHVAAQESLKQALTESAQGDVAMLVSKTWVVLAAVVQAVLDYAFLHPLEAYAAMA